MAQSTGLPLNLTKPGMNDLVSSTIPALAANMQAINNALLPLALRRVGATANRWYAAGQVNAVAMTTDTPTANVLRAIPLVVAGDITLDCIGINVTSAVAGNARMGIYADVGNLYPGSLILAAGEVNTGSTGVKSLTISQALTPGLYWVALVNNAAPTIRALSLTGCLALLGSDSTLATTGVGWSVAYTYAALPDTFPGGASIITAVPIPAIFVRAGA